MGGGKKMFFRNTLESYISLVKEKRLEIAACILVYLMGSFFYLHQGLELYMGLHICAADCYVMAGMVGRRIMVGIPIFLVITLLQARNSRNIQSVLRMGTRINIWWKQCLENVFRAVIMTFLETVIVGAYGLLMTPCLLNWNEMGSVFWNATQHTVSNVHFGQIVLGFGAVTVLIYLFTRMLFSFVEWVLGNYLAGICICLMLAFAENFSTLSILYDRTTIFYSQWLSEQVWEDCVWTFIIIIILAIGGERFAKKKEFYGT